MERHVNWAKRNAALLGAAVVGLASASAASAATISVDWFGTGGAAGVTQMTPAETAGVVPVANWNSFEGTDSTSAQALVDSTGAATGATVTWDSNNTWNTGVAVTNGDTKMMKSYLDTSDTSTTTVTVTGLPTSTEPYAVIVYYDGDNGANNRVGRYAIGSQVFWGRDAANATFDGTYTLAQSPVDPIAGGGAVDNNNAAALTVPAGNYMIFTGITDSFVLTGQASVAGDATNRGGINGIQIVPLSAVPEPTSLAVVGLAGVALIGRRRRR
jgi:hypothetical protein